MSGALAIFVKTPGRSALKTRLAVGCGEDYAAQWYRRAAAAVASVAVRARERHGIAAYWAVAEPGAEAEWPGLPTVPQGDGSLGARMARAHAHLVARHGFGLLLGADAPQLRCETLAAAREWLAPSAPASPDAGPSPSRLVLGPSTDGGFWLFGANVAIEADVWTGVRYSRPDTARKLQRSMQHLGRWRVLDRLTDVDRDADLAPVQHALQALPDPTPEQCALAEWMRASTPAWS